MENKRPKIFVGVLIMTKVKFSENSPEELVAVLQRRGKIDAETSSGFKIQSFPGLCEITSYGKAKEGENWQTAMDREMTEELGMEVAEMILKTERKIIYQIIEDDNDKVVIASCILPASFLGKLKLEVCTGGIEIIRKDDIKRIKYFDFGSNKNLSSTHLDEIIMTTLPIKKLEEAFEIYK